MQLTECPGCGRPAPTSADGTWHCKCGWRTTSGDHGAPVATKDDFTKQARGYQATIRRLREQRDLAEQALEDMKKVIAHYRKQIRNMATCYKREREAIVSQHMLDMKATGNAAGLLKEAAGLLVEWQNDVVCEDDMSVFEESVKDFLDKPEIKAILEAGGENGKVASTDNEL